MIIVYVHSNFRSTNTRVSNEIVSLHIEDTIRTYFRVPRVCDCGALTSIDDMRFGFERFDFVENQVVIDRL